MYACSYRFNQQQELPTLKKVISEDTELPYESLEPIEDLRGVHFLLLRAQEAISLNRAKNAQQDLDSAFSFLSKLEARDINFDTTRANTLAFSIERSYLKLLPQLDRFSPNSPLTLLLKGLSEERVEELTGDAPQLVRIHQLIDSCNIPIDANSRVAASIRFFQTRGKKTYATWLARSGRYKRLIESVLKEQNLPTDLLYISMIESGFNPNAYSRARAVGLWQFISTTGELECLKQNHWIDERRDPEKSTRAAANHLTSLYREFGDWRLATAAYNSGRGRVKRAIEKAGTRDFWKLELPEETENYVPLFMAAVIISKNPQLFGFSETKFESELHYEKIALPESWPYVDLRSVAKALDVEEENLRRLNPELRQSITPPNSKKPYHINLPLNMSQTFLDNYPKIAAINKTSLIVYHVQAGENLSVISKMFGIKPDIIIAANTIKNPNRILPGQELYIPIHNQIKKTIPTNNLHLVKSGETLSKISNDYGIKLHKLMAWNNLDNSLIKSGQLLKINPHQNKTLTNTNLVSKFTTNNRFSHTVREGQTLWEISQIYEIQLDSIKIWNNLTDSFITPGQNLILNFIQKTRHIVLKGDTFYNIAKKYNADPKKIAKINGTHLDSILSVGTMLIIPTSND